MKNDLPGAWQRVGPVVGGLIWISLLMLPAPDRNRYDAEFRAELVWVHGVRQLLQAVSLLLGAPALRRALTADVDTTVYAPHRSLRCTLGRHRYIRVQDGNLENLRSAHLECTRCLRLKEIKEYTPTNGRWLTS